MRFTNILRFLVIPALLLAILSPLAASAATGPADGAVISLSDGLESIEQDDEPSNIGAAVAIGIVALVLVLLAVVAVIGAAALGIIGLGYWQSSSE